jgi:hypothetical protein
MASGNPVVVIDEVVPTATLFAVLTSRAGGSTPAEQHLVWNFDAATIWYLDFKCHLEGYAGGGLTFLIDWLAATATSGVTRWGLALRANPDDAEDLDASHTYDYNDVDDTAASASGERSRATITFTDGADMDSVANGEPFILRLRRNASHANDTMAGNAQLYTIRGLET